MDALMDGASKDRIWQVVWSALAYRQELEAMARTGKEPGEGARKALMGAIGAMAPEDGEGLYERLFGPEREEGVRGHG